MNGISGKIEFNFIFNSSCLLAICNCKPKLFYYYCKYSNFRVLVSRKKTSHRCNMLCVLSGVVLPQ